MSERTFRRAVEMGEVATVQFGGLKRITFSEVERIRKMFSPKGTSNGED